MTPRRVTDSIRAKVWVEPPSMKRFLIINETAIYDGPNLLEGWRYGTPRDRCVICGRWTSVTDPAGQTRHPSCRLDHERQLA